MAQVHWTLSAADDLEEAAEFLSAGSNQSASELAQSVLAAVASLDQMPRIGRIVPEYQMERLRELLVRGYRVVYLLGASGETVTIQAIHHGSRDLRTLLGEAPWEAT